MLAVMSSGRVFIDRRTVIVGGAAALAASTDRWPARADTAAGISEHVREVARKLAEAPHVPPAGRVDAALQGIGYDVWRDLVFRREHGLWYGEGLGFELQFSPAGYIYETPVEIHAVNGTEITPVRLSGDMFQWGPWADGYTPYRDLAISGFRILWPLNAVGNLDEVAVFQGASYFRALGRNHQYGLSARGLALKTVGPDAEEFPLFRTFWIERPDSRREIVVHALLDGPSATGAYRFAITPGPVTTMDVDAALYPRTGLTVAGLAPLTSMFWFDAHDVSAVQDFRPAVHDSDGLCIETQSGDWVWRPLTSPEQLQVSAFQHANPRGFGLIQRRRDFRDYQDIEARYQRRPSAWIECRGAWGEGHIELVEIPAKTEYFDNIVAYWRPAKPLHAGQRHDFAYRLHWCDEPPAAGPRLRVERTGIGEGSRPGFKLFVVDFGIATGNPLADVVDIETGVGLKSHFLAAVEPVGAALSASAGTLGRSVVLQRNPHVGGVRVTFELDPGGHAVIELRLALEIAGESASEAWLYRWLRPLAPAPVAAGTP